MWIIREFFNFWNGLNRISTTEFKVFTRFYSNDTFPGDVKLGYWFNDVFRGHTRTRHLTRSKSDIEILGDFSDSLKEFMSENVFFLNVSDFFTQSVVQALIPEFFLLFFILFFLIYGVLDFNSRGLLSVKWIALRQVRFSITLLFFLLALYLVRFFFSSWLNSAHVFFHGFLLLNGYSLVFKIILVLTVFIVLIVSQEFIKSCRKNMVEFPVLVLFALFFMLFLVSSFDLFGVYLALEGLSLTLYILVASNLTSQLSLEAAIKYFCLGALSSGFLLYGIALAYLVFKTTSLLTIRSILWELNYIYDWSIVFEKGEPFFYNASILIQCISFFIFFGFWFKLSIFPCHAWTPDVYEGSPAPIVLLLSTAVKVSVFCILVRILFFGLYSAVNFWRPLFFFVGSASMAIGALGAVLQKKIKRFIGYTSINQMGFLLLGIACGTTSGLSASIIYLIIYLIMLIGLLTLIFVIVNTVNKRPLIFIANLRKFGYKNKISSTFLVIFLFSMAGIPPLLGFFGKYIILLAVFKVGFIEIIVLTLFLNIISTFYYVRFIKCLWFEQHTLNLKGNNYFYFTEHFEYKVVVGFCTILIIFLPLFFNDLVHLGYCTTGSAIFEF